MSIRQTSTSVKLRIDSHNFGKMYLTDHIEGFQYSKNKDSPATLTVSFFPCSEYLDLIQANDIVNLYVTTGSDESCIYNKGWVRLFFGYVDSITTKESIDSDGVKSVQYGMTCSDFQKAFTKTVIYNNPHIPAEEMFGMNFAGMYLMRMGVAEQGSPRFLIMANLVAMMGMANQWVLPAHYDDTLPNQIAPFYIKTYDEASQDRRVGSTGGGLMPSDPLIAKDRVNNDVLSKTQKLRDFIKKYISYRVQNSSLPTIQTGLRSSILGAFTEKQVTPKTVFDRAIAKSRVVNSFYTSPINAMSVAAIKSSSVMRAAVGQLTIDPNAPLQVMRSLLDIITFDYMEYCDGYLMNPSIWNWQGDLWKFFEYVRHQLLNELFADLRPSLDLCSGVDGIGEDLDGGVAMIPAIILREYPYTYYPRTADQSASSRLLDMKSIRKFWWMTDDRFQNDGSSGKDVEKTFKANADDTFTMPTIVDFGGATWGQKYRVTDYGYCLGVCTDFGGSPDESIGMDVKKVAKFKRGQRIIDSIDITDSDVTTYIVGRNDQSLVTGFEVIPVGLFEDAWRFYKRDISPIFRLGLLRRHGLRMNTPTSEFSVDLINAYFTENSKSKKTEYNLSAIKNANETTIDVGGKKIKIQDIGATNWLYMELRTASLLDHWTQHELEYLSGSISLRPFPGIRVGYILNYLDKGLSFYVDSVSHAWSYPGMLSTSVGVSRGQPITGLDYYLPTDRLTHEKSESFKLGINFPVADESFEDATTRQRKINPGHPGKYSNSIIWDNYAEVKVDHPDGVNVSGNVVSDTGVTNVKISRGRKKDI